MNVVFAGPSLHGAAPDRLRQLCTTGEIKLQGPAKQGDILRAVLAGATAIGLIDGYYDDIAAPWHREILFALSRGIPVFGGASIGAIRAAECAPFGMIGIGQIYQRYLSGAITDDADVALLHAPEELNYLPLTVPMVEVDATLENLVDAGLCSSADADCLSDCARRQFFKDRTWEKIVADYHDTAGNRVDLDVIMSRPAGIKACDAMELIEIMAHADRRAPDPPISWRFSEPRVWKDVYRKALNDLSK